MRKVILTESQMRLIKLIKESTDFAEKAKTKISGIKENLDTMYSVITYNSIAEIRDGDVDLGTSELKLEELEGEIKNIGTKISSYYDRYDAESFEANQLGDVYADLENRITTLNQKAMGLYHMIEHLKPFVESYKGRDKDWYAPFKNINPIEI